MTVSTRCREFAVPRITPALSLVSRETIPIIRAFLSCDPEEANDHQVAILMGSQSDWPTMKHAAETLDELGVGCEAKVISAHRKPERLAAIRQRRQGGRASR